MPAKKKTKSRQINLIPDEGLAASTSGRVLLWILSTFRIILIITELIVIGAFISRFWLDAKNTDLSDNIGGSKEIIQSLAEFEVDFKDIQNRLEIYDSYRINKNKINSEIKTLVSYKPQGLNFKSVSVDLEKVNISAISISEIEIQQYVLNLKSSGKFEDIKISDITISKNNSTISFSLSANIKQEI